MNESDDQIAAAIAALQAQRETLGIAPTELAIAALRQRLQAAQSPGPCDGDNTGVEPRLRLVTVLFVDVVGSTAIGRQLDPEDIELVIDGALLRLSAIVAAHGGRVLQYAGDSLLAVFGAVKSSEDDTENALLAGLAIIDEAVILARQLSQSHRVGEFGVRVGAHTGSVLLGSGVNGEQSVRGSAVNIAARMEQTALAGTLRITQDCYRHVRDLFEFEEQPPLPVKGMAQPLLTYLVRRSLRPSKRAARRGVDGLPTRFVNRLEEMRRFRDAYRSLCTGEPALAALILVADAGIGKSRLLAEFGAWATRQPAGVRILTARANERRMGQPYGILRELLTSTLAILDSDAPAQARAAWLDATGPVLGSAGDAALLGHLIGLDFSAHEAVRGILGDARQIRDRGYHYACELLRRKAAAGPPLLLLLDDLHWADDGSLDFFEHLLGSQADLPVLLLGLTRPTLFERRPEWGGGSVHQSRVELRQLDARYSEELATALLGRLEGVSRELRELIVKRAEGNPYYMEELVNMLIDQGAIVAGDSWQLRPEHIHTAEVPTTLTGVLQSRLDRLPPELRSTLQMAAVIGHVFWDGALDALGVSCEPALQALIARRLVVARESSALGGLREYSFKHHMLHRVCYDSVLKRDRRTAHARAARWLATQPGAAQLDLIAEHFERGGDLPQAIVYWQRAAEEAAGRYANAAALAHAGRALALGPGDDIERHWGLQLLVAKVLRTQSERTRLAVCLDELESLAERLGRDALRSEAAERRARYLSDAGDVIGTLRVGRQALAWAPSDAPECAARAHLLIASALSTIGRLDDALPHAQAGLAAARRAGNPAVEAMILNQMGMDANNRGDPGAAIALFEQALAHHRQAGNRSNEAGTLANMAYAAFVLGDYSTADVQFLQAADLCRQVGQHQSEGIVQINLALVRSCQGNAEGARACAQAALQLLRLAADRLGQAAALRVSGHAELALGEPERARASFAESRELFEELGLPHLAIESIAGQALQTLSCGDVGTALGFVEEILIRQTAGASLSGTDEPLRIGLVCHQVLAAAGDSRAEAVLATACTELQSRAASISDPSLRRTFLEQVPWHRELLRLRPPGPAR